MPACLCCWTLIISNNLQVCQPVSCWTLLLSNALSSIYVNTRQQLTHDCPHASHDCPHASHALLLKGPHMCASLVQCLLCSQLTMQVQARMLFLLSYTDSTKQSITEAHSSVATHSMAFQFCFQLLSHVTKQELHYVINRHRGNLTFTFGIHTVDFS